MKASTTVALVEAVVANGGTRDDLEDPYDVRRRLERPNGERADLIRAHAERSARRFEALTTEALR